MVKEFYFLRLSKFDPWSYNNLFFWIYKTEMSYVLNNRLLRKLIQRYTHWIKKEEEDHTLTIWISVSQFSSIRLPNVTLRCHSRISELAFSCTRSHCFCLPWIRNPNRSHHVLWRSLLFTPPLFLLYLWNEMHNLVNIACLFCFFLLFGSRMNLAVHQNKKIGFAEQVWGSFLGHKWSELEDVFNWAWSFAILHIICRGKRHRASLLERLVCTCVHSIMVELEKSKNKLQEDANARGRWTCTGIFGNHLYP